MNFKYLCLGLVIIGGLTSCYDLLEEKPLDFLTPENSYTNKKGFEAALANIYLKIRNDFYVSTDAYYAYDLLGVDVDYEDLRVSNDTYNEYFYWNTLNADNGFSKKWWQRFYNYIFDCNVIINRAESDYVEWISEKEKNAIVGEAKFLRAFAYRFLANMWGNAPIILEETTSPQFNYKSASQEEIYKQCKEDLEYAIQWMPDIDDQKGGRASKVAAQHLLAEILIGLKDYEGAVKQASAVIDNPAMSLMKDRFGKLINFEFEGYDYLGEKEPWGDVYWDLFREGNFNRIDGNHECIWNVQFEYNTIGGGDKDGNGPSFERWLTAAPWMLKDINGTPNWLKDILGGRPVLDGASPSDYVSNKIWDSATDIRNSKYNVQREYYWTNPESEFYGKRMTINNLGDLSRSYVLETPRFMKLVTAIHHGKSFDSLSGEKHDLGKVFKDWYIMRLSETYLLRAEAYLDLGNKEAAAKDINQVRERAGADLINPSEVNIDYILDERARELFMEEFRINTLMRLNKLTDYLMKYNAKVKQAGYILDDHLNKLPIPNSEIEANKEGGLMQNPGY